MNKFDINKTIDNITKVSLELISKTNLTNIEDLEKAHASVKINYNWYVSIYFGHNPELTDIWLWFSLESILQNGYKKSIDEQDTFDLSEESIRLNLRYLLRDWQ